MEFKAKLFRGSLPIFLAASNPSHDFFKTSSTSVWCPSGVSTGSHFIHTQPLSNIIQKHQFDYIINMQMTQNYEDMVMAKVLFSLKITPGVQGAM